MKIFDFNDFFEEGFSPSTKRQTCSGFLPSKQHPISKKDLFRNTTADVWVEDGKVMAKIDLPGVDKKDIEIKVHENVVEVKAEHKFDYKQEDKDFFREERHFAGFYKSFALPTKIDPKKVDAKYENGVLEIQALKTEEEENKIEVK